MQDIDPNIGGDFTFDEILKAHIVAVWARVNSPAQSAKILGISYSTALNWRKRLDLPYGKRGRPPLGVKPKHYDVVVALRGEGKTHQQIADQLGVSRQRIQQINAFTPQEPNEA